MLLMKRLAGDTGYLETFNRNNVTLVDIKNAPIEEITPKGLRWQGSEFELDSLVLATGFDAVTGAMTRIDIRGRDGTSLNEHWANGPRNYLGLMTAGFPNLFMIDGPGSPGAFFQPILLSEYQVQWVGSCIDSLSGRRFTSIEPTTEAEQEWILHSTEVANQTLLHLADSWYLGANIPGKPRVSMMYIGGFRKYSKKCNEAALGGYQDCLLS